MQHLKRYLPFPLLLILASCAALGVAPADTFNKKVGAAYSVAAAVYRSDVDLEKAGTITRDQALAVIKQADNAVAGIDLARTIHTTNATAGDQKLDAALMALQALQAALAEKQK